MANKLGIAFTDHFGIDEKWFAKNGVFNPTLDVDAPLFIDPFLLIDSKHPEFSGCAFERYEARFVEIHKLLSASQVEDDKAWKGALKLFQFSEAKGMGGTCLGYSKRSTRGRAFGKLLSKRALGWAKEVISLGVKDPELFSSMSLFEDGIGPDLISDMVTSIALPCILDFNERVLQKIEADFGLKIARNPVALGGVQCNLPTNPYSNDGSPIILLPSDVLKHLPIMDDPRDLAAAAAHNQDLRDRVNKHISSIFKIRTKKEKEQIRNDAMESGEAFQALLDLLKIIEKDPYDVAKDPQGLLAWRYLAKAFTTIYKLEIKDDPKLSPIDRINGVVVTIIEQFKKLVEDNRLSQDFYVDGNPRHERFAQLLFRSIAISYCDANKLDISPEPDAGAGPVDFKIADGNQKILVEIKLSTNGKVVEGFEKQLDAYMRAENAQIGHYVVIDVGRLGKKWERLKASMKANPALEKNRKIHLIDGTLKASASKL